MPRENSEGHALSGVFELTGQSGRNKRHCTTTLKRFKSSRRISLVPPLNGEESFCLEESHMCYFLRLSPFLEMSDAVVIFMPPHPSASRVLHVLLIFTICFGFHAILPHFPCIPFPELLTPTSSCWFLSEQLSALSRQRKWAVLQRTRQREGPEKASRGCLYLRGEFFPSRPLVPLATVGRGEKGRALKKGRRPCHWGSARKPGPRQYFNTCTLTEYFLQDTVFGDDTSH